MININSPENSSNIWTDADYIELKHSSKIIKQQNLIELLSEEPPSIRKICPNCKRPVAVLFDEGVHNTGECGCDSSRALCWRSWNGNVCCKESPYLNKSNSYLDEYIKRRSNK